MKDFIHLPESHCTEIRSRSHHRGLTLPMLQLRDTGHFARLQPRADGLQQHLST